MKYLKYFKQDSDYQSYMNGEGEVFLPNVSYVVGNNFVYFNTTKGKLEIYYKFDETNVSSYPYQMVIDNTHFKSFKVNGVEYIPQSEGSNLTTIEITDAITYNGDATVFTPYLTNSLGNAMYNSIKVTVPDFNVETEEIFLVMYASMDGQTMAQCTPLISQGTLTSVGDGEYKMIPEMVKNVNMLFEQFTASGLDVKIFFLGVESGYSNNSFVSKPTVAEYNAIKRVSYEISEPCEITAEVEWADNVNENDFFTGCFADNLQLSGFNDNLFKEVKFNNDVSGMFYGCTGLTSLDSISNWDTSNVTNMNSMFFGCSGLTSLDLSNWDTSNVTNMGSMFYGCSGLTSLDLSNWVLNGVSHIDLNTCVSLTDLNLDGLNYNYSLNFWEFMRSSIGSLKNKNTLKISLNGALLKGNEITSMYQMFNGYSGLTSLDLSDWDTSNVTNMDSMFRQCYSLTSVGDLSDWDTSNVTNMDRMFSLCYSLTSVGDLSNWDVSNVTNMNSMFYGCSGLTSVGDLSNWDVSDVTNMEGMFYKCHSLTSLDLSNWDVSNVTNMARMFTDCYSLTSLDSISNWETSNATNMDSMFYRCSGLTSLDLSNWDTSNVTKMARMFYGCNLLKEVKMGGNPSKVTDVIHMFDNITTNGTFYYNSVYSYSKIIAKLPSTWTAVPCTMVDGVLVPNNN